MKPIKYILLISGFLFLLSQIYYEDLFPYHPFSPEIEVTLYGTPGCPNCKEFIKNLEENKIPYEFKNVDDEYNEEMWDVIHEVYEDVSRISLPVVLIGDEVMINTKFEQAIESYGERTFFLFGF